MPENRRITRCPIPGCGETLQYTVVREYYGDTDFFEINPGGEIVDWNADHEEDWMYEDGERVEERFYCGNDHGILAMIEALESTDA